MIGAFRSVYRSKVSTCIVEYVCQYCESRSVCFLSVDVVDESFSKPAFQYDPLVVVSGVGNTCSRVPVNSVVCL